LGADVAIGLKPIDMTGLSPYDVDGGIEGQGYEYREGRIDFFQPPSDAVGAVLDSNDHPPTSLETAPST